MHLYFQAAGLDHAFSAGLEARLYISQGWLMLP
jgi:hypothetical protein